MQSHLGVPTFEKKCQIGLANISNNSIQGFQKCLFRMIVANVPLCERLKALPGLLGQFC